MPLMSRLRPATCAAVVFLSACGGGAEPNHPVTPVDTTPIPEKLTVSISVPSTLLPDLQTYPYALLTVKAGYTYNKSSAVTTACRIGTQAVPCEVPEAVAVGKVWSYVSARSEATGLTVIDSALTIVKPALIKGRAVVATSTGEYVPTASYVIAGDSAGFLDSTIVSADGTFSMSSRFRLKNRVHIAVRGDAGMAPMLGWVSSVQLDSLTLIGSPKSFTQQTGTFAGQTRAIDLVKAATVVPSPSILSYYPHAQNGGATYFSVGAPKTRLGCVVFMPMGQRISEIGISSTDIITAADSIQFLATAQPFAKAFSIEIRTCTQPERDQNVSLYIFLIPAVGGDNGGVIAGYADFTAGQVTIVNRQSFGDSAAVLHELGHALLGLGHTCMWDSIMLSSCGRYIPSGIYAEDVVYASLMSRTRELERKYHTRFSLPFSINGAWVERFGLSEEMNLLVLDENGRGVP